MCWLGPWVLDSTSFGAERVSSDGSGEAAGFVGSTGRATAGYSSLAMTKRTVVRCRRRVRPREPRTSRAPRSFDEEDVAGRR